jgi:hypothetical protein
MDAVGMNLRKFNHGGIKKEKPRRTRRYTEEEKRVWQRFLILTTSPLIFLWNDRKYRCL